MPDGRARLATALADALVAEAGVIRAGYELVDALGAEGHHELEQELSAALAGIRVPMNKAYSMVMAEIQAGAPAPEKPGEG